MDDECFQTCNWKGNCTCSAIVFSSDFHPCQSIIDLKPRNNEMQYDSMSFTVFVVGGDVHKIWSGK
jgi:hypothetical protein